MAERKLDMSTEVWVPPDRRWIKIPYPKIPRRVKRWILPKDKPQYVRGDLPFKRVA